MGWNNIADDTAFLFLWYGFWEFANNFAEHNFPTRNGKYAISFLSFMIGIIVLNAMDDTVEHPPGDSISYITFIPIGFISIMIIYLGYKMLYKK